MVQNGGEARDRALQDRSDANVEALEVVAYEQAGAVQRMFWEEDEGPLGFH